MNIIIFIIIIISWSSVSFHSRVLLFATYSYNETNVFYINSISLAFQRSENSPQKWRPIRLKWCVVLRFYLLSECAEIFMLIWMFSSLVCVCICVCQIGKPIPMTAITTWMGETIQQLHFLCSLHSDTARRFRQVLSAPGTAVPPINEAVSLDCGSPIRISNNRQHV